VGKTGRAAGKQGQKLRFSPTAATRRLRGPTFFALQLRLNSGSF